MAFLIKTIMPIFMIISELASHGIEGYPQTTPNVPDDQEQLNLFKNELNLVKSEMAVLKSENNALKSGNEKLMKQVKVIKSENGDVRQEMDAMKSENVQLEKAIDVIKHNYDQLENQVTEIKSINSELKSGMDVLKSENKVLKEQMDAVKSEKVLFDKELEERFISSDDSDYGKNMKNVTFESKAHPSTNEVDGFVSFSARPSTDRFYNAADRVLFDVTVRNYGGYYNATESIFVCPATAYYLFSLSVQINPAKGSVMNAEIYLDDEPLLRAEAYGDTWDQGSITLVTLCEATHVVAVYCSSGGQSMYGGRESAFTGVLLRIA